MESKKLKNLQETLKHDLPDDLKFIVGNTNFLKGNALKNLIINTICFGSGLSSLITFAPCVKIMDQSVPTFLKGILASSTTITGSFLRIPLGYHIHKTGGKKGAMLLLGVCVIGMFICTLLSFTTISRIKVTKLVDGKNTTS